MAANRRCWWLGVGGAAIVSVACGGGPKAPPPPTARDGALIDSAGMGADGSGVGRRAQMLVATSDARGQVRFGASAADFAELLLLDAETQRPVGEARIEALAEEEGGDGYLVRVTKELGGYRPEVVRVTRGQQRTVPLAALTPDVPGRAVRVSQRVYREELLGETDLEGVSRLADQEDRPEIVFVPVLDAATMMGARFSVYRSPLPRTLLAVRTEGGQMSDGQLVRSRARVVSTSGPRRAGARVQPQQLAAAGEKNSEESKATPAVVNLQVAPPDSGGGAMVSWGLEDVEHRVLAFEVGLDTTRPNQRLAGEARSLPLLVRQGEHFFCVRPVFPGSELDAEVVCKSFDAPSAPPAANVRVRVRPPSAGTAPVRRKQPMPVEVEVENVGTVDARPFKIDVVVSRDGRSEGGLGEVRTLLVDGVKAGGTAVRRTEITPPRDGSLYVVAQADTAKQLVEANPEDNVDRLPVTVMPVGDNRSPVLSLAGTAVGGEARKLVKGQALKLRASADDPEDGDLSAGISWWSSRDGKLADGPTLDTTTLSPGTHRVRAQVADRGRPAALPRADRRDRWPRSFTGPIYAEEEPESVSAEFPIEVVDPVVAAQSPPVISAGPDLTTTVGGEVVPLARAEDADGDPLTVAWTASSPEGAALEIADASQLRPRFRPPAAGRYRLVVQVSDGKAEEKDELEVLALAPTVNHRPVVNVVLPATGLVGMLIRAQVTATDEDGDGLTLGYELGRPPDSTVLLTDGETTQPAFTPDQPGFYGLMVTADDGRGGSASQMAGVQITPRSQSDAGASPDAPVVIDAPAYPDGPAPDRDGGYGGGDAGSRIDFGYGPDHGPPPPPCTDCSGSCVYLDTDQENCGACGRACGANQSCVNGSCVTGSCGFDCGSGGYICCGGDDAGGPRCTDPRWDWSNCGGCGIICAGGRTCQSGLCRCDYMQADCNGICKYLNGDADNCGACGNVCPTGSRFCGGYPAPTCQPCSVIDQTECDGKCVDTQADQANCGACGRACAANQACVNGDCVTGTCGSDCGSGGYICCGGDDAGGPRCTDPRWDWSNCGGCGITCAGGRTCQNGLCRCDYMQADCGGVCKYLNGDADNCGACGNVCPTGSRHCGGYPNPTCQSCSAINQTECDGRCVDTQADQNNCGACGLACSSNQACLNGQCVSGTCSSDCGMSGYICCGGEDAGGNRCADPRFDWSNCGGCGIICTGGRTCQNGACRCDYMQVDCDGACRYLHGDADNCGACGNVCPTGSRYCGGCPAPTCQSCSTINQTECNGRCVDTNYDQTHCGACGPSCGINQSCIDGTCVTGV